MIKFHEMQQLFDCSSEEEWSNLSLHLLNTFGFERIIVSLLPKAGALEPDIMRKSLGMDDWLEKYSKSNCRLIDPLAQHCTNSAIPLIWDVLTTPKGSIQQGMFETVRSHGCASGITLPLHGPNQELGIVTLATDSFVNKDRLYDEIASSNAQLLLLSNFIFESGIQFIKQPKPPSDVHLTIKEKECLQWVMAGKSSWDISQILSCSEATINFHISNLRRKFEVKTRQQVIAKAIRYGLI